MGSVFKRETWRGEGEVGPYRLYSVLEDDVEGREPSTLYTFEIDGKRHNEWYSTLDKAILSAVCTRHTGPSGAGGSGVGTAADWFAKAIGLE